MATSSTLAFFQRHTGKVILIFILVAITGAILTYRPAVKKFKTWRAESLIAEARGFADSGDWKEVKRTAVASLQNENSLEALRLLAKASIKTNDPRTLEIVYALFNDPDAGPSDRVLALEQALVSGDLATASAMVSSLSAEEKTDPALHRQIVHTLLLNGKYQEAILLADDPAIVPKDPSVDLLLAQGLAGSDLEGARELTTARLDGLMKGADRELALQALTFLTFLRDDWIHEPLAEAAVTRFQEDPDLSVAHRLELEFLKLGLAQTDRKETIEKMISEYRENHLTELIHWLKRINEPKQVVQLTESEVAKAVPELFSERISALEKLGLWELLDEELANPPVVIPEPLLYSARAITAFRIGNQIKFIQSWEDAVQAAKLDLSRNWFYQLAASARLLEDTDRQMDALVQGIQHPLGRHPNATELSPLFQWLLDRGETEKLLKISGILLRREPQNPLLINNYLYLKALYGKVNSDDVAQLRLLVKTYPEKKDLLDSLALVLLQNDEPQAALDVLKEVSSDPSGLASSGQAVFANALYALGKEEEAFQMAENIRWKDLTKAELNLLALTRPE